MFEDSFDENRVPGTDLDKYQFHANAISFLERGDETEKAAAQVLRSCSLEVWAEQGPLSARPGETFLVIRLAGTREVYEILKPPPPATKKAEKNCEQHPFRKAILKAFGAVLPGQVHITDLERGVTPVAAKPDVHNQAARGDNVLIWNNLRFRSLSERRIAEALDRVGALFLPNCMARLGNRNNRANREVDFLICHSGKWGILEVDGEPFHPPSRTAQDHERDRIFRMHGILVVEHFNATDCFGNPDDVVKRFLEILKQA